MFKDQRMTNSYWTSESKDGFTEGNSNRSFIAFLWTIRLQTYVAYRNKPDRL